MRYLIVGGLAVVAHGYVRFTQDLAVILDVRESNVRSAITALAGLGYRALVPVALEEFADAAKRAQWVREKKLTVFSLFSPQHPETAIDLFVESPLDFDKAYAAAIHPTMVDDITATIVSLDDLLVLKSQAGRPLDLIDIDNLNFIKEKRDHA